MALSCYSAPGELDYLNSDLANMFSVPDDYQTEYLPDILGLNTHAYCNSLSLCDSFCNNVFDHVELTGNESFFLPEKQQQQGGLFSPVFPENGFPEAKRHKVYDEWYDNGGMLQDLCDGVGFFERNPPPSLEFSPPFGGFSGGCGGGMVVQKDGRGGGGSGSCGSSSGGGGGGGEKLSSQSIAARQRRRKITEKTQELGKLIPGGQKMNTAEMFHAAYKYIKFLQAQVGVLESLNQVEEESIYCEELNPLLESPLIQEKLYLVEKCLVPAKFAESTVKENRVQPNSRAMRDFKELIGGG